MSSTVAAAAAAAEFASSSSSHTGPRGAAATEDDEDAVDDKEYTQPPTNDDDDDEDVATLIEHYVTSTAALQVKWDSLSGQQQQQIIRASRSILANNEEDEDEDFYDAQEYGQDEERTVLMNDDHDNHDHDHHANNNDAAAVVVATVGLANEDDAGPVPPASASPPIDDNNADDDDDLPPPPPNDDAPTPVLPPNAVVDNLDNAAAAAADDDNDELPPPPEDPAAAAAAVNPAEETPAVAGGNAADADAAAAAVSAADDGGFDEERHTERCGTQIRRRVCYLKGVVVQRLRRLTGRPTAFLQRAVQGRKQHHSNSSTNTTIGRSGAVCCGSFLHAIVQLPPIPSFAYTDKTARVVLTTVGFDPDNLNERLYGGWTPLLWFIVQGNVAMVRYLISRGADGRQADVHGMFPMFLAALDGRLEIMKLLSRDGGAHEDIRRVFQGQYSPLYAAFARSHFHVVQWLILNEALPSPRDDAAGDGIDDALMRRDLRPYSAYEWDYDHRQTVLTWARDAVKTHDNVVKLPLTKLNDDVLKRIADYVVGTPKQVRTLRQFVDRLQVFIKDEPFVE